MQKIPIAHRVFLIVFILLLNGCRGNPDVQVNELSNSTTSYDETVRINNCGGKADSVQTKSRSFSTDIAGGIEVGVKAVVEGVISAKYSQVRNISVSQSVTAPAGTDMVFVLRWKEEVHAGNVIINGDTGTYTVNIPVAVDQISSQDLICLPPSTCAPNCAYKDMVVGFIQLGSESNWRLANTASFKETAAQLGITLKFYDGQNNVQTQIEAFRQFIQDPTVNVIVLAAADSSGFDNVLKEAQNSGKLVVLEDRPIDSSSDLYYTYIGSDFVAEGQKAAKAMCDLLANSAKKNVVEISGTEGSAPAIDRAKGFREKMSDCGITITSSQSGNWITSDSKAIMAAWLKNSNNIQGVFAHNDDEAIGAIQAIKEAGLVPGRDIQVVGVDATYNGFQYMISGELGASIECSPMFAPQVYEAALKGLNGETPPLPKYIPSQDSVFFAAQGADTLKAILATRKY